MKTYAIAVTIVALLAVGIVLGANVQPILTGAGYVVFPESVTSASLHASGGNLILTPGTNKKVGVGTNSPTFMLDVNGDGLFYNRVASGATHVEIQAGDGQGSDPLFVVKANPGAPVSVADIYADSDSTRLLLAGPSGIGSLVGWIESSVGVRGILGYPAGSGDMVYRSGAVSFATGTERYRVTSGGNFLIGTATDDGSHKLQVAGAAVISAPCNTSTCGVTTNGTQTLTNKTIDYLSNTITNLPAGGYTAFTTPAIAVNTVYQNTSGGAQYIQVPASVLGVGSTALAYCDSANPPTTIVSMFSDVNGVTNQYGTLSFVVLNNYYWKIATGTNLYDGNARVWR